MSSRLKRYLLDFYGSFRETIGTTGREYPIQIDDQDDNDDISCFCTIFATVGPANRLDIELCGRMPVTNGIADLVEIYSGRVDESFLKGDTGYRKITLQITPQQIDVLLDLATQIKKTVYLGKSAHNPHWDRVSARTISSLHRFVRTIKEYLSDKNRL